MPRDDWAKYARRDRGRKVLRESLQERLAAPKKKKKAKPVKQRRRKSKVKCFTCNTQLVFATQTFRDGTTHRRLWCNKCKSWRGKFLPK